MGEPAALELLAEECTELGHAALKLARKKRAENPTPDSTFKIINELHEEVADVSLCLSVLTSADWYKSKMIDSIYDLKLARWKNRMVEHGHQRTD